MNNIVSQFIAPAFRTFLPAARTTLSNPTVQVALAALALLALAYKHIRTLTQCTKSLQDRVHDLEYRKIISDRDTAKRVHDLHNSHTKSEVDARTVIDSQKNTIELLAAKQYELIEALKAKAAEPDDLMEQLKFYKNQAQQAQISSLDAVPEEVAGMDSLPAEVVMDILGRLSVKMLCRSAQVSCRFHAAATDLLRVRANEYGYKGNLLTESKIYLRTLFQGLRLLALKNIVPRSYWNGDYAKLEMFFRDVKGCFYTKLPAFNDKSERLLLQFSQSGDTHLLLALLRLGIDPAIWERFKYSALHDAVQSKRLSTVELLLDEGTDFHLPTSLGPRRLEEAILGGNEQITKALLDRGAGAHQQNNAYGDAPLLWVLRQNNLTLLKTFLDDPHVLSTLYHISNPKMTIRMTAIHYAASRGQYDALKLLLEKGGRDLANYNVPGMGTPLHAAARNGNLDCIELLFNYGADLSLIEPNTAFTTALVTAKDAHQTEASDLLHLLSLYVKASNTFLTAK